MFSLEEPIHLRLGHPFLIFPYTTISLFFFLEMLSSYLLLMCHRDLTFFGITNVAIGDTLKDHSDFVLSGFISDPSNVLIFATFNLF